MAVSSSKNSTVLFNLSYIGVIIFAVWGVFLVYLGTYAPTAPDEIAGRIYQYNYHGTVVYMTLTEKILQYALPGGAVLFGIILNIIDRHLRKSDKRWPPEDIYSD